MLNEERNLVFYCDLHGHSRAHGAFVYGNKSLEIPESTRIFPYILSKLNQCFSFESSKFGIQTAKEKTARVTLFKELQHVPAIYTLEASFSGTEDGIHYTPDILKSIGRDICRALIPYCNLNVPFSLKLPSKNADKNKPLPNSKE